MGVSHEGVEQQTLDVSDLPADARAAIRELVRVLRAAAATGSDRRRLSPSDFSIWPGGVREPLTRDGIYRDVG